MDNKPELDKALFELKKMTGISLHVQADSPEELNHALAQIHCLSLAYKEKYNKNYFFKSLMTEGIPAYDVNERAARMHIEPDVSRVLFLIHTKNTVDETVMEILKNLFPSQSKTYLIPMDEKSIVVLRPRRVTDTIEDIEQLAHMIVDTLNMEALTHVQVAYSNTIGTLLELPGTFYETNLALRVGTLFYSEQTVFAHNRLGIGRLIYKLPVVICENFLKEIYHGDIPGMLDEEASSTINKFFQNNLNIAETARQLHMHRNTLIYRIEQIEKRTGLDIRRFEDAMTFKIATMVINYLQTERNS